MTALLTIPEAAGRLSVAPRTVRRMLASGELTRVTIRRAVRVTPESVEEYLRFVRGPQPSDIEVEFRCWPDLR